MSMEAIDCLGAWPLALARLLSWTVFGVGLCLYAFGVSYLLRGT